MSLEIEVKLKVDSHDPIRARLQELGARCVGRVLELNHILDRSDGSLRMSGCALRVRSCQVLEGDGPPPSLTYKGPRHPGPLKKREEIETPIEDSCAVLELLTALDFVEVIRFEKRRETWTFDDATIELDDVPYLGTYVEIEGRDEAHVHRVQKAIGLDRHSIEPQSYITLLQIYCQGHQRSLIPIDFSQAHTTANPG
jgi:adenylate cyclase class 2